MAALCREVALPVCVVAWIAAFGSAGFQSGRATPVIGGLAPSLAANAEFTARPQAAAAEPSRAVAADSVPIVAADEPSPATTEMPHARTADTPQAFTLSSVDIAPANAAVKPVAEPAKLPAMADTASASREAEPIVTAALTDPSEKLPADASPPQAATAGSVHPDTADVRQAVGSVEILDECYVIETCVDRYLFALYQRTKKEDAVKQEDKREVSVKRKGKLVTVTRTFTTVVDEDFGWKDPKAAEKAGKSMPDYVIGGMDQAFKQRLFRMLLAAEQAGLSPGITSGFRDDYRQSIASGLKAASNRSYHGGSIRGGYGHGLAADVVSIKGDTRAQRQAASEVFWKWIDMHGGDFGVARPYQSRDPPHVGPIDGQEYADHFHGKRATTAGTDARKHTPGDHGGPRRQNTARSSKSKTT